MAEVYHNKNPISVCDAATIAFLKAEAAASPLHRARLCLHRSSDDAVNEMLIAITRDLIVRPHRHPGKTESFLVVDGDLDLVVFDDEGGAEAVIAMGPPGQGRVFHHRLSEPKWHSLLVKTEFAVFVETTCGPFRSGGAEFAPFAPADESDLRAFLTAKADRGFAEGKTLDSLAFVPHARSPGKRQS